MQHEIPSSLGSSTRTAVVVLRVVGVFAGGLGLFLAYGSITEFIRHIRGAQSFGGVIVAICFDVLLALIAFWCMRSCYQSWRSREDVPLRSLSAILAIFFLAAGAPLLDNSAVLLPGLTVEVWKSLLFLGAVTLASTLYVSLTWWLSSAFSIVHGAHRIPEFVIIIICVLLWLTSSEFLMEVIPKEPGYEHVPPFPWGLAAFAMPFAAAIFVGRILRRCGSRNGKHNTTHGAA